GVSSELPASDPCRFEYHAAQLERFLQDYHRLQEQLLAMKVSYESNRRAGSFSRVDISVDSSPLICQPPVFLKTQGVSSETITTPVSVSGSQLQEAMAKTSFVSAKGVPQKPHDPPLKSILKSSSRVPQ
ncbi:unnamed protein product, partial [Meganyctiphanes norvegica]